MPKVTLHIEGMTCSHCLNAVSKALHAVPGAVVESVQMGRAEVEVASESDKAAVIQAVVDAGYAATAAP
jgi:copper chaperone CopZ